MIKKLKFYDDIRNPPAIGWGCNVFRLVHHCGWNLIAIVTKTITSIGYLVAGFQL